MVLLEAMYFGVPCISSKNGGSTTLINNKKNGIVEENFIKEVWSKDIIYILENKEYKNMLSTKAKETIELNYTWNNISSRFINCLNGEEE